MKRARVRNRARRQPARAALDHPNLSGGLGVVISVTALLVMLRHAAGMYANHHVTNIWTAGSRLAQQTSASHLLRTTKVLSRELVEELERHSEARKETRA